jgi:hypothetical protein
MIVSKAHIFYYLNQYDEQNRNIFICRQISFSLFTSSCKQVLRQSLLRTWHIHCIIPINTQNLSLRDQTFGQIVKNQERKIVYVCFLWVWERKRFVSNKLLIWNKFRLSFLLLKFFIVWQSTKLKAVKKSSKLGKRWRWIEEK